MDFSGVYPMMDMPSGTVLDCTLVRGCMRYCDDQALKVLQDKIAGCPSCGIHFIDGGDYHYLTKLWTDTLKEPFSLVLLDHHPDMQPPLLDGMLSCGGWVLDMLDRAEVDSMIAKYRKLGDLLVVSFHGGAEGAAYQHVPRKTEYYVGEERGDVYDFAHHCIDQGADIVVGHGPHVPRGMELYKGHLIAYSLGNFCAPYRMGVAGAKGYAPLLVVTLSTSDGTLKGGRIHSFLQHQGIGPRIDRSNAAAKNMRQLSAEDFPDSKLDISPEGELTPYLVN